MTIILCLFIAFFVGVPICFALGIVSIGSLIASGMPLIVTVQRMFTGGDSIALIAIPLFMLSGELMFRGGMSKRLVDFADTLLGHFPSGLAMVSMTVNLTIGMCTPPLGVCLFVSSSIAKISLKDQMRDLLPMLAVLIGVLLLVTYIPGLTLWLPSLFK